MGVIGVRDRLRSQAVEFFASFAISESAALPCSLGSPRRCPGHRRRVEISEIHAQLLPIRRSISSKHGNKNESGHIGDGINDALARPSPTSASRSAADDTLPRPATSL
jgi:cation transport ATPase